MEQSALDNRQAIEERQRLIFKQLEKLSNPNSIHGIYPYRGKMSALDASNVISQLPQNYTLLDPFCGTGTIVYEAQARGMTAIGVDNNPLACIIARGKTESLSKTETLQHFESAIKQAKTLSGVHEMPSWPAKFFHRDTREQIMRMISISDSFSNFELSVLYGSICLAARACNHWTWSSTSFGRISDKLRSIDFYGMLMRKAQKHIEFVLGYPEVCIYHHDTRRIQEIVEEGTVDVVYSSPPYFDALDYTGYYSRLVLEILGMDRKTIRRGLIQTFSTFREEMSTALRAIDAVLHDESLVILVVGDRMVNRKIIRGSEFFSEIAPWDNPYCLERSYSATASGIWDKINSTRRKEQIVVWDLKQEQVH
ncbi:MAG: RsmD family RNA methyltransferase [Candidatus Thorarchaeota archaeon]|nr:MAG: RsmD family RNA methyltransferase [Candidatus Thorarchaeota archaeon]